MKHEFKIKDIVEGLEIPRERFKEWVYQGFIEPSIQKASGAGTQNIYSSLDVYMIAFFKNLIEIGYKRDFAAKLIKKIQKELAGKDISQLEYVFLRSRTDENGVFQIDYMTLKSGCFTFAFKLGTFGAAQKVIIKDNEVSFPYLIEPTESWTHMQIINFSELKKMVDKAI